MPPSRLSLLTELSRILVGRTAGRYEESRFNTFLNIHFSDLYRDLWMATYKSLQLSGLEKEPGSPRVFATTGTRKPTEYSSATSQMEQHSLMDRRLWDLAPSQMEQTVLNFVFGNS